MGRHRKNKNAITGSLLVFIFVIGVPLYLLGKIVPNADKSNFSQETFEPTVSSDVDKNYAEPNLPEEIEIEPTIESESPTPTIEVDLGPGETVDNPIVLTASEFISALNNDIDAAKTSYKYKWIQVTGVVISVTHNEVRNWTRTYMGDTTHHTTGEMQYTIAGVTIKSGLIYWINSSGYRDGVDIIAEMDMSLCDVYYGQRNTVTVVGYCAGIDEYDVVLTDGRYPPE